MNEKRATCPPTENGRLPRQETWKLQDGREVQIKMSALQVDPGHEGSSSVGAPSPGLHDSSGGNREQPKSNEENSHDSHREGVPTTGSTGSNRAKNDGGHTEHSSKDSNPDRRDQNDDLVMTGVDGNQLADSSALDNLKREVGSDEDHNDDLVRIGVDANHSGDQPAQDGEVGSNVDQHKPLVMTGVDANHSADSPGQENFEGEVGQDDLNGEINPEIHRGEKLQQSKGGEQNHSSGSGAEADMTDDNSSSTDHSLPAAAQDDLKREPAADADGGNKRQPKSDGQNHTHDSTAQSNQSGIAKSDGAHHMQHVSKNSSFDQTNRNSRSYADNFSTSELDYRGANHTNLTVEETPEILSFHSILAILAAVLSLMCAFVCMVVSCFWRGSDYMMKERGGYWGVEDSESEAILPRS